MELKGKNVIYIGGFGGIGQKCIEELLKKEISNLIIFDLNKDEKYLNYIQIFYKSCTIDFIRIDLTQRESIELAYQEAKEKIGQFDLVINGSGIFDDRLIDMMIAINLTGVIHSNLTALSYMNKSKGGRGGIIVNISSALSLDPHPMVCVYSATKCGVTGFTRALSSPVYFEKTGVSFITICPGPTDTQLLDDIASKMTIPEYSETFRDFFSTIESQTPEECAKSFIQILGKAENGSIWFVDCGLFKEVKFPVMCTPIIKE